MFINRYHSHHRILPSLARTVILCREPLNPLITLIISICRALADLLIFKRYSLGKKRGEYLEVPYRLLLEPNTAVVPEDIGVRLNVEESPSVL